MTPEDQFPPPGAPPTTTGGPPPGGPPPGPPPGWGPPQPSPWGPQGPGVLTGAAHKPGAVPLRPLRLGDLYDAAFKVIRFNPRATVGSAVLVASVAMAVPVVVTVILTFALDLTIPVSPTGEVGSTGSAELSTEDAVGLLGSFGALLVGLVGQGVGLVFVTAMVAHVTLAAAVGRRLSLGEAWRATHGSRWRLIGLVVLTGVAWTMLLGLYVAAWVVLVVVSGEVVVLVIWGLVSVPAFIALTVWAWVRLSYLAVPALMLERTGVLAALGRAFALTRRQFWRTFGIALLTSIITQAAASILTIPLAFGSQLSLLVPALGGYQVLVFVLTQALSTIVAAAFVSPFTAAVTSLQYVDQRMRKEAFDVELMSRAGITGP